MLDSSGEILIVDYGIAGKIDMDPSYENMIMRKAINILLTSLFTRPHAYGGTGLFLEDTNIDRKVNLFVQTIIKVNKHMKIRDPNYLIMPSWSRSELNKMLGGEKNASAALRKIM
jgi:hypothetical protein